MSWDRLLLSFLLLLFPLNLCAAPTPAPRSPSAVAFAQTELAEALVEEGDLEAAVRTLRAACAIEVAEGPERHYEIRGSQT